MKKYVVFLFLLGLVGAGVYGLKNRLGQVVTASQETEEEIQKRLGTFHPVVADQMFVAVVLAENAEKHIERNLHSLFNQTHELMRIVFVDNGSADGTYELAQDLVEKEGKEDLVTLLKMEEHRPALEILYEVIGECDPYEVVALIDGKDWLAHENVFDHLNCGYANPDVWMTYSRAISHPDYQEVGGGPFPDRVLSEKKLRTSLEKELTPLVTFYAGFFHRIKLQDFLRNGSFMDECMSLAVQIPLVEMGPEHLLFMDEVSYIKNESAPHYDNQLHLQKVAATESHLRNSSSYPTLTTLKLMKNSSSLHRYKSDFVLFSEDSPLHLYACLESILLKARDINEIYVLYKGNDHEFQRAYLNLQNEFRMVQFLNVCDYPGNDFSSLVTKVLSNRRHASPYVVIGDDHMIFEESIQFHECIEAMEKAHADQFFLSLNELEEPLPYVIPIMRGIYAWQLGEQGAYQGLDLVLCRKNLFETLESVADLSTFKQFWSRQLQPESVALFFEEKKILPIKCDREPSPIQKREWGHKFIEGFKIDLPSISCEIEEVENGVLPLIKREKRRIVAQVD